MRQNRKRNSINKRLKRLLVVCLVPLSLMILYLIVVMNRFSENYDGIVQNIALANLYNISFKEEIDYEMYIVVVNSERADELLNGQRPEEKILSAQKDFEQLSEKMSSNDGRMQVQMILKSLESLKDCVLEIEQDARTSGMYDKNIERLELNIYIITELIQDQIQKYIYYETSNLDALRSNISAEVERTIVVTVLLLIGLLIVAGFIGRRIGRNIAAGVGEVLQVSQKAGQGDFLARVNTDMSDEELVELGEGFNQMVERVGNLIEDVRTEQRNLRITEQKLLQAQINPHFLYNTLDTIIWLAEVGQKEEEIQMVTSLSEFFRTTLSNGRDRILVSEEEKHVRSYLQVQQVRYQDILDYEIDIPKSMHGYTIIKLLLQPLVENALYHGIKNKRGKGCIWIKGCEKDGVLYFTVKDNGIGMTPERLQQVKREMEQEDVHHSDVTAFGLYNVMQRIRLNYGSSYGLKLESRYGEGTIVTISIPAISDPQ